MANPQQHHSADTRTFSVAIDFGHGEVVNLAEALDTLVEFIQEDRVTADDDNAMVCAEALARYLRTGETGTITVDNR